MGPVEKYYSEAHTSDRILPSSRLYVEMMKELAVPRPSVKLLRFPKLSEITGGFRAREFTILCGATGCGKTTVLANWSADLIEQRIPHFVASVETGATDFIIRTASFLKNQNLNKGQVVPVSTLESLDREHGENLNNDSLYLSVYDNRYPIESLMADLHYAHDQYGCKIAMLDNLNFFMEVTRAQDAVIEMDRVVHELIIFCKRVDMHVVMVMHPKKTNHGRVENEFDIKGSSTAVQEAHNIFLFNRPMTQHIRDHNLPRGSREFKITKMRRRGEHIGSMLFMKSDNGVRYEEVKHCTVDY